MKKPKIDKNIALPPPHTPRPPSPEWAWLADLKCGDSFLVPSRTLQTCAIQAGRKMMMRLTSRKTNNGARIWRVK